MSEVFDEKALNGFIKKIDDPIKEQKKFLIEKFGDCKDCDFVFPKSMEPYEYILRRAFPESLMCFNLLIPQDKAYKVKKFMPKERLKFTLPDCFVRTPANHYYKNLDVIL